MERQRADAVAAVRALTEFTGRSQSKYHPAFISEVLAKVDNGKTLDDALVLVATKWKLSTVNKAAFVRRATELDQHKRRRRKQIATARENRGKE